MRIGSIEVKTPVLLAPMAAVTDLPVPGGPWKKGLKTTYYLRSRPATRINKATVETAAQPMTQDTKPKADVSAQIACSLENPESCESCQ